MELDLRKFAELANETEPEHESAIYVQLSKAFDVIYDLTVTKKIKRKKVIELLQKSGLVELNEIKMNGWWNSTLTKKNREEMKAKLEVEAQVKDRAKKAWSKEASTLGKLNDRQNTKAAVEVSEEPTKPEVEPKLSARHARARIPVRKPVTQSTDVTIPKITGDLMIPWASFLTHVKSKHDWNASTVSIAMQDMDMVTKKDGKFILVRTQPSIFLDLKAGDTVIFASVEVGMATLTNAIEVHLGLN